MTGPTAPRHILTLSDLGADGLRRVLDHAHARKSARAGLPHGAPDSDAPLAGHVLAAIFQKPSTRTRLSFDIAMRQLGGATITLAAGDMQLGRGETIADTARVLSGFVDVAMIRANHQDDLEAFAAAAAIPLLNGLSNYWHPCQIVADLMTAEERHRRPASELTWAWLGDGNNVCNSLIEAAGLLRFPLTIAGPVDFVPDPLTVDTARQRGATVMLTPDPAYAVATADVIVTDTWISMGDTDHAERMAAFPRYQLNEALLAQAPGHAIVLHCLPAHRGEEITDAVIDGPQSAVWDEAANRVHAQKAMLLWALGRLDATA